MELVGLLIIFLLLPLVMIAGGLIYVFKKDWAWRLLEQTHRSINPQRTALWEDNTTIGGVFLIVAGIGLAVFVLVKFLPLLQNG